MSDDVCDQTDLDRRVLVYYGEQFDENDRLVGRSDQGLLEFERTQEFVTQRVPAGSRILDVGGATGIHAAPLAARGDIVTLIDPVPSHIAAAAQHRTFVAELGDARALPQLDGTVDAVLLLGPLYHLAGRADRLRAIREAARVTRPGGFIFAGAISRTMAHVFSGTIAPARSPEPVQRSPYPTDLLQLLEDGSTEHLAKGFPGGHFHHSEELADELTEAGIVDVEVHGLEGPGGMPLEVERTHDDDLRAAAMLLAKRFSDVPGIRDLSQHLLAIGRVDDPQLHRE